MLEDIDEVEDEERIEPSFRSTRLCPYQRAIAANHEAKKDERRAKLLALGATPERAEQGCQSATDYALMRQFLDPR